MLDVVSVFARDLFMSPYLFILSGNSTIVNFTAEASVKLERVESIVANLVPDISYNTTEGMLSFRQ